MTKSRSPARLRITRDQLAPYLDLARQVAASRAETAFLEICTTPGWDQQDMPEAAELVLNEIERVVCEALAAQESELDETARQDLHAAIDKAFLDRLHELDEAAGTPGEGTMQ